MSAKKGTSFGPGLLVELERDGEHASLRAQLEDGLREAVRSGRLPGAKVTGVAAGLHAIVRLPRAVDGLALATSARERSVGVYPLGYAYAEVQATNDGLVLGYANLSEGAIFEGVRRLAAALAEV